MNRERLLVSLGRLAREQIDHDVLRGVPPLDEAACDRIADRLARELGATAIERAGLGGEAARALERGELDEEAPRSSVVVPIRPRGLPRALPALGILAAAAAATGLVMGIRGEPPEPMSAEAAPGVAVPEYRVEVTGGDVVGANRAQGDSEAPDGPTLLGRGAVITVVLRPDRPAPAEAAVRACVARGGSVRPWDAPWSRSAQGSFLARGTRESLFSGEAPGELTLLFAVERAGALPSCEDLARTATLVRAIRIP